MAEGNIAVRDTLDLEQLAKEVQARRQASKGGVWMQRARAVLLVAGVYVFFTFNILTPALIVVAVNLAPVIVLFLVYAPQFRRNIGELRRARELLHHLLTDLPRPEMHYPTLFPWQIATLIALMLAATTVFMYQRYVPEWEAILAVLLAAAAALVAWMSLALIRAYPTQDANGRAFLRGRVIDWTAAVLLLLFLTNALPAWLWQQLDPAGINIMALFVLSLLGIIAFTAVLSANQRLPVYWVFHGPLERGDYDGALRRVDLLLRWRPQNIYFKSMRGILLLFAMRPDEAERVTRDLLANPHTNGATVATSATNLGYALLGQKQYGDALPFLEAGVRIMPEYGSLYSAVASYYSRQKIEPQRAMELRNRAVELTPRPKKVRGIESYMWVGMLSGLAVAAAQAGDDARANVALNQAFKDCDRRFIPVLAVVHCDAGLIARLQGHEADAQSHFAHAVELDPHGYAGHVAREALQETV
jgi:tetratricopeptide (TPR) repeat protein